MQLVTKLDYKVSYGKLFHLIEDIRKSNPLVSKMNGLSLQHRKEVPNPWNIVDGLESLRLYNGASEKDFCQIHEKFLNTEFENIINDFKLYRSRIMIMEGKTCYSFHADSTWRLHVPIVTNNDCVFYFPEYNQHYHLELGTVYLVNTTEKHTFINASQNQRVHMVGCIDIKDLC